MLQSWQVDPLSLTHFLSFISTLISIIHLCVLIRYVMSAWSIDGGCSIDLSSTYCPMRLLWSVPSRHVLYYHKPHNRVLQPLAWLNVSFKSHSSFVHEYPCIIAPANICQMFGNHWHLKFQMFHTMFMSISMCVYVYLCVWLTMNMTMTKTMTITTFICTSTCTSTSILGWISYSWMTQMWYMSTAYSVYNMYRCVWC